MFDLKKISELSSIVKELTASANKLKENELAVKSVREESAALIKKELVCIEHLRNNSPRKTSLEDWELAVVVIIDSVVNKSLENYVNGYAGSVIADCSFRDADDLGESSGLGRLVFSDLDDTLTVNVKMTKHADKTVDVELEGKSLKLNDDLVEACLASEIETDFSAVIKRIAGGSIDFKNLATQDEIGEAKKTLNSYPLLLEALNDELDTFR